MRIIKRSTLQKFWANSQHADSEGPLKAWYLETQKAQWQNPAEVKKKYQNASVLKSGRVVFNIAGNKYRLVTKIHYNTRVVFVRFVGTHKEYDGIDADTV
jgi:mRNA interferase HigB